MLTATVLNVINMIKFKLLTGYYILDEDIPHICIVSAYPERAKKAYGRYLIQQHINKL